MVILEFGGLDSSSVGLSLYFHATILAFQSMELLHMVVSLIIFQILNVGILLGYMLNYKTNVLEIVREGLYPKLILCTLRQIAT